LALEFMSPALGSAGFADVAGIDQGHHAAPRQAAARLVHAPAQTGIVDRVCRAETLIVRPARAFNSAGIRESRRRDRNKRRAKYECGEKSP